LKDFARMVTIFGSGSSRDSMFRHTFLSINRAATVIANISEFEKKSEYLKPD
jgi:hypothetical protein